jgi:hypothetical protein
VSRGLAGRAEATARAISALASLEAALHLIDHIDPALAADQAVGDFNELRTFMAES